MDDVPQTAEPLPTFRADHLGLGSAASELNPFRRTADETVNRPGRPLVFLSRFGDRLVEAPESQGLMPARSDKQAGGKDIFKAVPPFYYCQTPPYSPNLPSRNESAMSQLGRPRFTLTLALRLCGRQLPACQRSKAARAPKRVPSPPPPALRRLGLASICCFIRLSVYSKMQGSPGCGPGTRGARF
jgi:hypothetical protein